MSSDGFFKITHELGHSYYFTWVLNSYDRDVFRALVDMALTRNSEYYDEGIIITNASVRRICLKIGTSHGTVVRSLKKLNKLGMIITFKYGNNRNSSYLIGFRTNNNDRVYLLEYLVKQYDNLVKNSLENILFQSKSRNSIPKLKDSYAWCVEKEYRDFITKNASNPTAIKYGRLVNGKKIYEALFNRDDDYQRPLSEGKIKHILLNRGGLEQVEI